MQVHQIERKKSRDLDLFHQGLQDQGQGLLHIQGHILVHRINQGPDQGHYHQDQGHHLQKKECHRNKHICHQEKKGQDLHQEQDQDQGHHRQILQKGHLRSSHQ